MLLFQLNDLILGYYADHTTNDLKLGIQHTILLLLSNLTALNPLNTGFELSFLYQRGEIFMPKKKSIVPVKKIEESIVVIRGEKVMLDSYLAALYGVTTKRLNEQVKRNKGRFPEDFMFQLTKQEKTRWSQIATTSIV
jgi:hypothetical protein